MRLTASDVGKLHVELVTVIEKFLKKFDPETETGIDSVELVDDLTEKLAKEFAESGV